MLHKKPDIPCGCLIFCFGAQSIRPPASQPSHQGSGGGKALSTAGGGNFDRAFLARNKRSAQWAVAPIEGADRSLNLVQPTASGRNLIGRNLNR